MELQYMYAHLIASALYSILTTSILLNSLFIHCAIPLILLFTFLFNFIKISENNTHTVEENPGPSATKFLHNSSYLFISPKRRAYIF